MVEAFTQQAETKNKGKGVSLVANQNTGIRRKVLNQIYNIEFFCLTGIFV